MRRSWCGALVAASLAGCGSMAVAPPVQRARTNAAVQAINGPTAPALGPLPLAVVLPRGATPVHPHFTMPPRSGLLFDLDTGRVLWRRRPTKVVPIASLTKMMTALVVLEHVGPGAKVFITRQARHAGGSKVGVLPLHHHVGLVTMLYGLLLPSGNDAAIALAQRVAGTQTAFIGLMNARARQLNLTCTHYTTVSGIVDRGNHSCAVDLAAEARAMLDVPLLAKIVATPEITLRFPIKGGRLELFNNNPLLRTAYPGTIGIKTGFTTLAGRCLVAAASRDGHRLGVILLDSPNPGKQARVLLDRGFAALASGR